VAALRHKQALDKSYSGVRRLHDLRRKFGTTLVEVEALSHIVERLLNHPQPLSPRPGFDPSKARLTVPQTIQANLLRWLHIATSE
jgi:hypothetical protein